MKFCGISISVLLIFSGLICQSQVLDVYPFETGEILKYKIRYGWFTIGEAEVNHEYPSKADTFNVNVVAYTTGIVNWIAPLYDSLSTSIDKSTLHPVRAYANRREGKDRRKELDFFDFERDTAQMIVFEDDQIVKERMVAINDSLYDMLSTYAFLRTRDYGRMSPGDSLMMKVYYEGRRYDFGIEYEQLVKKETLLGEVNTHAMYILFPISGTFPKPHMVKVWVTADEHQVPVLIEAQMKFGKARCELIEWKRGIDVEY